ncbi:hypothetical protein ONZ45_g7549 [Pleurotus djamor]|nr:hypothetical protein ONZ45_g7549 [Pleurotus djamor]
MLSQKAETIRIALEKTFVVIGVGEKHESVFVARYSRFLSGSRTTERMDCYAVEEVFELISTFGLFKDHGQADVSEVLGLDFKVARHSMILPNDYNQNPEFYPEHGG